jgi:hypothetical protein
MHHNEQNKNTDQSIWRRMNKALKATAKAYNVSINKQTGFSPYEITHGHYPDNA